MKKIHAVHLLTQLIIKYGQSRHKEALETICAEQGKGNLIMKKEFEVEVSYVFKGKFFIKAESQEEANEYAEKHCGLVLGGDIHSTLMDEDVNWDFPVHPEKIIHTDKK
jgi:hypothetical protein